MTSDTTFDLRSYEAGESTEDLYVVVKGYKPGVTDKCDRLSFYAGAYNMLTFTQAGSHISNGGDHGHTRAPLQYGGRGHKQVAPAACSWKCRELCW